MESLVSIKNAPCRLGSSKTLNITNFKIPEGRGDHSVVKFNNKNSMEQCIENINVIHHKENQGLATARNSGIKASNSKMIAFLDGDMEVMISTLLEENQARALANLESSI